MFESLTQTGSVRSSHGSIYSPVPRKQCNLHVQKPRWESEIVFNPFSLSDNMHGDILSLSSFWQSFYLLAIEYFLYTIGTGETIPHWVANWTLQEIIFAAKRTHIKTFVTYNIQYKNWVFIQLCFGDSHFTCIISSRISKMQTTPVLLWKCWANWWWKWILRLPYQSLAWSSKTWSRQTKYCNIMPCIITNYHISTIFCNLQDKKWRHAVQIKWHRNQFCAKETMRSLGEQTWEALLRCS